MAPADWKLRLERFFYDRAELVSGVPTLRDHSTVSAKDPRLSARPEFHQDMVNSVVDALRLERSSSVLEVGCASGYVACGLAPRVGRYTGVDLAVSPLEVARRMRLAHAQFINGDGGALPFADATFDAAFVYDVYTNFPTFTDGVPLIKEMARVVRPGGRVLIGSVTNKKKADAFQACANEVAKELLAAYGPMPQLAQPSRMKRWWRRLMGAAPPDAVPEIVVYSFDPDDFTSLGQSLNVTTSISDVHPMNPYRGFRYNVVFAKGPR
jgi:SAM-dependent methyltransferase